MLIRSLPPFRLTKEQCIYLLFIGVLFFLVIQKALFVPPTQDEVTTFFEYVLPAKLSLWFLDSANNHLLNTALAVLFTSLFGDSLFVLRLPNVLAFMLYAWFAWRLAMIVRSPYRWLFLIGLLCNYTLLEYFALARGYGLSFALLLGHLHFLVSFQRTKRFTHLMRASVLIVLAASANLSLINECVLSLVLLAILSLLQQGHKHSRKLWWLVVPGGFTLILIRLGFLLRDRGALYHGSHLNFMDTTMDSVLNFMRFSRQDYRIWLFILGSLVFGFFLQAFILSRSTNRFQALIRSPYWLLLSLLLGNICATIALSEIFSVNYPTNRVGLYFVPIGLLCFAMAAHQLDRVHTVWRVLYGMALLLPALALGQDLYQTYQPDRSHVEAFGNLPEAFFEQVAKHASSASAQPVIQGDERLSHAWRFYNYQHGNKINALFHELNTSTVDFKVVTDTLDTAYRCIATYSNDLLFLVERRHFTPWNDSIARSPKDVAETRNPYITLFKTALPDTFSTARIHCRFHIEGRVQTPLGLILSVKDSSGIELCYSFQKLDALLRNSSMDITRSWPIPKVPAGEVHVYVYNMLEKPISLSHQHCMVRFNSMP